MRCTSIAEQTENMKVNEEPWRTIWVAEDGWSVEIIDQTLLPHAFRTVRLGTVADTARVPSRRCRYAEHR
ncbi:MAG: methylthioribose-1-phosphate isomerase [Rhodospirillaceae bacterium]|nr:MAG: methylthioribose-1-phosphate isomerase [Rhodospirillaceae bacterium]